VISAALQRLRRGEALERPEMRGVIHAVMQDESADSEVAELLRILHARGETLDEVVGAAEAMRDLAVQLPDAPADAVDTCGTGGDASNTFNISTVAALVVAGAGVPVAKHGNRAATSRCGSADVLEALGVNLEIDPGRMAESVHQVGIGFLFARACHPAMARVAPIRAKLGTPSIFNRLGPLTNPMRVRRQLVGIADASLCQPTLDALAQLGAEKACVVHSEDGLDEASTCSVSCFWTYDRGTRTDFRLSPGELLPRAEVTDLRGGDSSENARIARSVLAGEPGARRNIVLLNAAAALHMAGRAGSLAEGIRQSEESIDSGAARATLERWIEFCEGAAPRSS
jgi:anthranilate phosphoribosyltransferase